MPTTNERELQKKLKDRDDSINPIFIAVLIIVPLCIMIVMREDYKELDDKRLEHIRILQKVTHGCDRCSEHVQRSQR